MNVYALIGSAVLAAGMAATILIQSGRIDALQSERDAARYQVELLRDAADRDRQALAREIAGRQGAEEGRRAALGRVQAADDPTDWRSQPLPDFVLSEIAP